MLKDKFHDRVQKLVTPWVRFLDRKGIAPDHLTLAGAAMNLIVGMVYASGNLIAAGLLLIVAGLGDALDGPLARITGKTSRFGAFLDSTVDRYSDVLIFGGIAVFFASTDQIGWLLIVLGILMGSFITSYAKARAENLIERCQIGFFERAERIVILAAGSLIPPLFPFALWVLLIGTNWTAIQRILYTRKALSGSGS